MTSHIHVSTVNSLSFPSPDMPQNMFYRIILRTSEKTDDVVVLLQENVIIHFISKKMELLHNPGAKCFFWSITYQAKLTTFIWGASHPSGFKLSHVGPTGILTKINYFPKTRKYHSLFRPFGGGLYGVMSELVSPYLCHSVHPICYLVNLHLGWLLMVWQIWTKLVIPIIPH